MPIADCMASMRYFFSKFILAFNRIHQIATAERPTFTLFVPQKEDLLTLQEGEGGVSHSVDYMGLMDFYHDYQWLYLQRKGRCLIWN